MTPIADDISDALKALQAEVPTWRKPPDATPTPDAPCAKCGGLGYIWDASYITGRIECPDCVKPTGSAT